MKLSKDKEINNTTLLGILIGVGFISAVIGFDSSVTILLLFGTFFIVYLFYPRSGNKSRSLKNDVQLEQITFSSPNEPILSQAQRDQINKKWAVFGEKSAFCPSCHASLPKFPVRKSKCKACNQNINRGQNPLTKEYVLFSEKQDPLFIELLWMSNGVWKNWFDNFNEIETIRNELAVVYKSSDPSKIPFNDVIWAKIQRNFVLLMSKGQWYPYLRELEKGIRFLDEEQRSQASLPLIYQYIYLACNVTSLTGTEYEEYSIMPPSIGQIYLIENNIKEIANFDELYLDFMNTRSSLPKLFKGTVKESLDQYKKERNEYYQALEKSARKK
ncbi:TPA: hypothetical protein JA969_12480 [Legionella pneumophila]|nr:hypothetical protein [Legionella pneumophila]HAT8583835.1 hypothetical protein [Legionella pneumophila]